MLQALLHSNVSRGAAANEGVLNIYKATNVFGFAVAAEAQVYQSFYSALGDIDLAIAVFQPPSLHNMQNAIERKHVILAEKRHQVPRQPSERLCSLRRQSARQTWQELGIGPRDGAEERRLCSALDALRVREQSAKQLRALLAGETLKHFADVRGAFRVRGDPLFESCCGFAATLNKRNSSLLRHFQTRSSCNCSSLPFNARSRRNVFRPALEAFEI
jgi:hypothetical protein